MKTTPTRTRRLDTPADVEQLYWYLWDLLADIHLGSPWTPEEKAAAMTLRRGLVNRGYEPNRQE